MATSSIFWTPQFKTERAVKSLVDAIESSEKQRDELSKRMDGLDARRLTDPDEIHEFLKTAE